MNVDAVVLRRMPAAEHDQAVVLYGRETGRLMAVARGSLKSGSRQAPALDEGNLIRCELVPGRGGVSIMTGAQAQRCWSSAKASPAAWAAAAALLQATDALVWDGQPDDRVWDALVGAMAALDQGREPLDAMRACQAELLEGLGYGVRPLPRTGARRSPLDDELERVAQRHLTGPELLYGLLARRSRP